MVLGLQAQLRNERARAQAIFDYALALTRRELQARLWAIEDGALRGDLDNVLLNYDIALRTSLQAQEILFPILTSALDNSLVRQRLVPRLKSAEEWKDPFLHFAARTRSNPQDVALLVAELERARIPVALVDRLALVDALFETGSFEAAWSLYRTIDPAAKRDRSRGTEFTKGGEPHSVLDWTLGEGAFFQQGGSGALVGFSLAPATSGTLLRQAQLLPPGDYQLTGVSASVDQPAQTRPYWLITCADGRELGRVELQNSPSGEASFAGSFSVPANCPTQTVSLIARASDEIGGVTGQIIRAAVTPALEGAGG